MLKTNVMLVSGCLTRDPQQLGEGGKAATYSISVPKDNNKWDVIPFKLFGLEAQKAMLLKKGNRVSVLAHTESGSYTAADGKTKRTVDHIVDRQFTDFPGFDAPPFGLELLQSAYQGFLKKEDK